MLRALEHLQIWRNTHGPQSQNSDTDVYHYFGDSDVLHNPLAPNL